MSVVTGGTPDEPGSVRQDAGGGTGAVRWVGGGFYLCGDRGDGAGLPVGGTVRGMGFAAVVFPDLRELHRADVRGRWRVVGRRELAGERGVDRSFPACGSARRADGRGGGGR